MKCLVTGAAGFIGSHLCERLLVDGHSVVGVDSLAPHEGNLGVARNQRRFQYHSLDLRTDPLDQCLDGVEAIFHLAALTRFPTNERDYEPYQSCNVVATQRLLESLKGRPGLQRFVYGSSSSVYGRFASGDEMMPTKPSTVYGLTKLAAEQLCHIHQEHGLPVVVVRYYSVYGPRQRPDMGIFRFIQGILDGAPLSVYGDGQQVRGNTFVSDAVDATVRALKAPIGETYNVGGQEAASVLDIVRMLEAITGRKAIVERRPGRPGEQRHALADTSKAYRHLGWQPGTDLDEGLLQQVAWQHQRRLPRGVRGETWRNIRQFRDYNEANSIRVSAKHWPSFE